MIDRVHGDGRLARIPLTASRSAVTLGKFRHYEMGPPVDIQISTSGNQKRMVVAHEIGHYLLQYGLPRLPELDELFNVIRQSSAISAIQRVGALGYAEFPDGTRYRVGRSYTLYLQRTHEMFARAYAQFVAVESGDARMLADLASVRSDTLRTALPVQWDDADFAPIADAFRRLFRAAGWMA